MENNQEYATDQRSAVSDFYSNTGGNDWKSNTAWNTNLPFSFWRGLSMDVAQENIIGIHLDENNLSGILPESVGRLAHLKKLKLRRNYLSSPLPQSLSELNGLTHLDLGGNSLQGTFPAVVGEIPQLRSLSLDRNKLSGSLPIKVLEKLKNIEEINISENLFSGKIPLQTFVKLPALKYLSIFENQFDAIPDDARHQALYEPLFHFYSTTKGRHWLKSSGWNTEQPLYSWRGILVDKTLNPVGLQLRRNNLSGTLPNFRGLEHFSKFDLRFNNLKGPISELLLSPSSRVEKFWISGHNRITVFEREIFFREQMIQVFYENTDCKSLDNFLSDQIVRCRLYDTKSGVLHNKERRESVNSPLESEAFYSQHAYVTLRDFKRWTPMDDVGSKPEEWHIIHVPHILLSFPNWLKTCESPLRVYGIIENSLFKFLRNLFRSQNVYSLRCVACLHQSVVEAGRKHAAQENELLALAGKIEQLAVSVFLSNSFDDRHVLAMFLLPTRYPVVNEEFKTLSSTENNVEYLRIARSFDKDEFMGMAIKNDMKLIFGTTHISAAVSTLFYSGVINACGYIRLPSSGFLKDPIKFPSFYLRFSRVSATLERYYAIWWTPRTCPAVMFAIEGFSKLCLLLLVGYVSAAESGASIEGVGSFSYEITDLMSGMQVTIVTRTIYSRVAAEMLSYFVALDIAYEVGQLIECGSLIEYFGQLWNRFDVVSLTLITYWIICRYFYPDTRLALSIQLLCVSAIPLCFSVLQYLLVLPSFGKLIVLLFAMATDIFSIVVIACIILLGFIITMTGLYHDTEEFNGYNAAAQTLFLMLYGGPDFTLFTSSKMTSAEPGIIIASFFTICMTIIILNLLLGRMATTFQKIEERSINEWRFRFSSGLESLLLLRENSPLCMLPAPLNIFPIAFMPFEAICRVAFGFSICGTVTNVFLALIGAFFRTICFNLASIAVVLQELKLSLQEESIEQGREESRLPKFVRKLPFGLTLFFLFTLVIVLVTLPIQLMFFTLMVFFHINVDFLVLLEPATEENNGEKNVIDYGIKFMHHDSSDVIGVPGYHTSWNNSTPSAAEKTIMFSHGRRRGFSKASAEEEESVAGNKKEAEAQSKINNNKTVANKRSGIFRPSFVSSASKRRYSDDYDSYQTQYSEEDDRDDETNYFSAADIKRIFEDVIPSPDNQLRSVVETLQNITDSEMTSLRRHSVHHSKEVAYLSQKMDDVLRLLRSLKTEIRQD